MDSEAINILTGNPHVQRLIEAALDEDVGSGDVTTNALLAADDRLAARVVAREALVVAGGVLADMIFAALRADVRIEQPIPDGDHAAAGTSTLEIEGSARAILTAERLLLNFMQRMSGIATLTRRYVKAAAGTNVAILDTRKTTPGLRAIEKYAVVCGGGANHRHGLYDMAMIKDNHRAFWERHGSGGLKGAVERIRSEYPSVAVELEVDTEPELRAALAARPDWILLDNMSPAQLRRCVEISAGRCKLEASGRISLAAIPAVAATGVDAISVGALTHSAAAVDLGLDYI